MAPARRHLLTPYPQLDDVLRAMVTAIEGVLGDNLVGVYLQGSFAVGDFDEDSDVDFVVVIDTELTREDVAQLQVVHGNVFAMESEWARHLEGSYFTRAILADTTACDVPLWYLDHGRNHLVQSTHCNTAVVRAVVAQHGVTLFGPPPATLLGPVPSSLLKREMFATINDWGADILANPERYNNRFYQGFIVLNYCRMLHDLSNGRVGSKRAGAEWASSQLDPQWRDLIDRAWSCRPNPAVSVRTPADADDFKRTLEFLAYAMAYSKNLFDEVS